MADPLLLSFAYGAGVISFFSPCAFPMLPAYVSYYLGRKGEAGEAAALGQGLLFGGITLLGMVAIFGGLGSLLSFAGTRFLVQSVNLFGFGMGFVLVALGVLLLTTHWAGFSLPLRAPRTRGPLAFFLYGVAYALVSLGCTFPIFVVVVVGALLSGGFVAGLQTFLVYALGMGTVMLFVSLSVATSREYLATRMNRIIPAVRVGSAVLLVGIGAYMVYYYGTLVSF